MEPNTLAYHSLSSRTGLVLRVSEDGERAEVFWIPSQPQKLIGTHNAARNIVEVDLPPMIQTDVPTEQLEAL